MDENGPLIRNISDTARWVAVYRAQENERPDAVFRDPFARTLAGDRGEQIAKATPSMDKASWSFVARTTAFDRYVAKEIERGVDVVLNLAAGLDTRPYRLAVPPGLKWLEVDLPEILDYKAEILSKETPRCALERVALDLSNHDARRGLFARVGRDARHVLVLCEGLLIYLMRDEVMSLARDLAAQPAFERWAVDVASPGLLTMMNEQMGDLVREAGAPYLFAPAEGPVFFETCGWKPIAVRSLLKTAAKLQRLPFFLRVIAMLPEGNPPGGSRPWSGVCLLERI